MPVDIARAFERDLERDRPLQGGGGTLPTPSEIRFLPEPASSEAFYDEWKETLAAIAAERAWNSELAWLEGEERSTFVHGITFHTTLERHMAQFFLFALFGILAGYLSLLLLWNHSSLQTFILRGVVGG